jgi:N-acetylmuramoyl-L-alanine amidase
MLPCIALADTLIVAGHTQLLTAPLIAEKNDVLAPVLPTLRLLGARAACKGAALTIMTPTATLRLAQDSLNVAVDNRKVKWMVAPRLIDGDLYLPVLALAPLLHAQAHFDPTTRTLAIHPILTVSTETRGDGQAILVRCAAPLQFTSGNMDNPPRAYFDFKDVALGMAEQQVPVDLGRIVRLRLAQYSDTPATVRLVVDLTEAACLAPTVSEQGCLVTILVGKKIEKPVAPPPMINPPVVTPTPAGPISLLTAALRAFSAKQSELTITTDGPAQLTTDYQKDATRLTLTIPNGLNALTAARVRTLHDKIVEKVEVTGSADKVGATIAITFRQDAGYLIQQDPKGLRVLIGTFDISNMTIVLDAGHGGHDVGAVGVNGTMEKTINLAVILRAAKLLEGAGAKVLLTRCDDTFIPLNDRPALANNNNADLFVSVHCNSMPQPNTANGTQTYYNTARSSKLAEAIHRELLTHLSLRNGGVRTAGYLVVRKSCMPSVLLELAFINNTREETLLASANFQQKAAEAILAGVRNYAASRDWQLHKHDLPETCPVDEGAAPATENTSPTN